MSQTLVSYQQKNNVFLGNFHLPSRIHEVIQEMRPNRSSDKYSALVFISEVRYNNEVDIILFVSSLKKPDSQDIQLVCKRLTLKFRVHTTRVYPPS